MINGFHFICHAAVFVCVLPLIVSGCSSEETRERQSCAAKRKALEVLKQPNSVRFDFSQGMKTFELRNGWCEQSRIQVRLSAESLFKRLHIYEVSCRGEGQFNLRFWDSDSEQVTFVIDPYSESDPAPQEYRCKRVGVSQPSTSGQKGVK